MSLKLSIGEISDCGPRSENQDALRVVTPAPALASSKGHLIALADGVSQCADGGLAARSTLQSLALDYYATPETWLITQSLDRLLMAQNRWLRSAGGGEQPLLTTLTALVLRGRRYTLAHIGDCRAYLWRAGKLSRLTSEHVWEQPGMQHVLKRAMGLDQHLVMDYSEGDLQAGDQFLLLCDGVWAALNDRIIAEVLQAEREPTRVADSLVRAALRAGSQDNCSALCVRVDELPESSSLADTLASLQQWPLPQKLRPGQLFEDWTVDAQVNESRQSLLYRVHDQQQRPWLLKTLPPALNDNPQAQQALLLEEWFLRRVCGRHFPEVHSLPHRHHLYFVMREYQGQTLAQILAENGPLPLEDWLQLARQLLRSVSLLHRRNIVHRDIKPENLLQEPDGSLRLLDFGIAFCPGLSAAENGNVPGTPTYIAPECYNGEAPAASQDLFAVGITLYRLLCGQFPWGEIEPFQQLPTRAPTPPSRYRPDLPAWVDGMLLRAIERTPQQRFETAEEWLLLLDKAEQSPVELRSRPLIEREPLKFWKGLAGVSLLLNFLLICSLLLKA